MTHHLAPQVGFEPTTYRLTAERSTTELLGHILSCFSRSAVNLIGLIPLALHTQDFQSLAISPRSTRAAWAYIKLFLALGS